MRMKKKHLFWLLVLIALGVAVAYWYEAQQAAVHNNDNPPAATAQTVESVGPNVEVTAAQKHELGIEVQAVGSLWDRVAVMLRAEINGKVAAIDFAEGGRGEKGRGLLQIDVRLLSGELQQACANMT